MDTKQLAKDSLRRVADAVGGQSAVAALVGLKDRRGIWPYFNTDRPLPPEYCPPLEKATAMVGKRVTCEELAPDVTWRRVPDAEWLWHDDGKPLVDVAPRVAA